MSFGISSLACRLGAEFLRSVRVYRNAIDVVGSAKDGGLHAGFSGGCEERGAMMGMGGVERFATSSLTGTFSCATMGRKDDGRSGRIISLRDYRTVKCQSLHYWEREKWEE